MLLHSYLKSILDYDSATGIFRWKINKKGPAAEYLKPIHGEFFNSGEDNNE